MLASLMGLPSVLGGGILHLPSIGWRNYVWMGQKWCFWVSEYIAIHNKPVEGL